MTFRVATRAQRWRGDWSIGTPIIVRQLRNLVTGAVTGSNRYPDDRGILGEIVENKRSHQWTNQPKLWPGFTMTVMCSGETYLVADDDIEIETKEDK